MEVKIFKGDSLEPEHARLIGQHCRVSPSEDADFATQYRAVFQDGTTIYVDEWELIDGECDFCTEDAVDEGGLCTDCKRMDAEEAARERGRQPVFTCAEDVFDYYGMSPDGDLAEIL